MAYLNGSLSAICDLYHIQRQKAWVQCISPRDNKDISILVRNHCQQLMFDSLNTTSDLTGNCPLRDAYNLRQFELMLRLLWQDPEKARQMKTHIRDRMCMSLRHNMILRDEDLRSLRFAETFHMTLRPE